MCSLKQIFLMAVVILSVVVNGQQQGNLIGDTLISVQKLVEDLLHDLQRNNTDTQGAIANLLDNVLDLAKGAVTDLLGQNPQEYGKAGSARNGTVPPGLVSCLVGNLLKLLTGHLVPDLLHTVECLV